jgi:hypothetical protein
MMSDAQLLVYYWVTCPTLFKLHDVRTQKNLLFEVTAMRTASNVI